MVDLYRGKLSVRLLGVLVRQLPAKSALVTALNGGQPVWSLTDHLLADLWALLVRLLGDPKKVPDDIDNPRRAEIVAKAKSQHKQSLKERYMNRKSARRQRANSVVEVSK